MRPWYDVEPGRHLVALHLPCRDETEAEADARAVLKGEVNLQLRAPAAKPARARRDRARADALCRFAALKAWRNDVAREHNLPACVVFHDATLAQMAREAPATLADPAGISGVGAKKLQAYGREILRVSAG